MTRRTEDAAAGHDSFLDIVANIVGILIILVMVVGVRARNAPVQAGEKSDDLQPLVVELEREQAVQRNLYNDVVRAAEQIVALQQEAAARQRDRDRLATVVSALEHRLDARRGELDATAKQDFDLSRRLSEIRIELEQARRERDQVLASSPQATVVECYPTPLSTTVDDHETHFQLRGGRIAYIPLDELVERFKQDARRQAYKLFDLPELTETIGPVGGFRFRYTLERQDVSIDAQMATGRGSYARLRRWTLIPVAEDLGERVDDALSGDSEFRRVLARLKPSQTTITIWTYADSFGDFRRIKKDLYHQGFATAGRPLPLEMPITGSPEGSKSAAE